MSGEYLEGVLAQKLSREDFCTGLSRLLLGGVVIPTVIPPYLLQLPSIAQISPVDQVQTRKSELERKHGVLIRGLVDGLREARRPFFAEYYPPEIPRDWDTTRLSMLDEELETLPPHFRSRNLANIRLMILLGGFSTIGRFTSIPGYPHIIELSYFDFDPQQRRRSRSTLAHELTHIATPMTVATRRVDYPNGSSRNIPVVHSPWYDTIEEILGGKFLEFAPSMWAEVMRRRNYVIDSNSHWIPNPAIGLNTVYPDDEVELFAQRLIYCLNHITPFEFIGVMGEIYREGEVYFKTNYGDYVGQERATALFNFTRNEIFRGWTY